MMQSVYCIFSSAHSTSETLDSPNLFPIHCTVLTPIKYDEHWLYCQILLERLETEEIQIENDEVEEENHYRLAVLVPAGKRKLTFDLRAPSFLM